MIRTAAAFSAIVAMHCRLVAAAYPDACCLPVPACCDPAPVIVDCCEPACDAMQPAPAAKKPSAASAKKQPTPEVIPAAEAEEYKEDAPSLPAAKPLSPPPLQTPAAPPTPTTPTPSVLSDAEPSEASTSRYAEPPAETQPVEEPPTEEAPAEAPYHPTTPVEPSTPPASEPSSPPPAEPETSVDNLFGEPSPLAEEPPAETTPEASATPSSPPAESTPPAAEPPAATPEGSSDSLDMDNLFGPGTSTDALNEPGGWAGIESRQWLNRSGSVLADARVAAINEHVVTLACDAGQNVVVDISKLSDGDLAFLRRQIEARQVQLAEQSSVNSRIAKHSR